MNDPSDDYSTMTRDAIDIRWLSEPPVDLSDAMRSAAQQRQNMLTKPPGSLGALEQLAITIATIQGRQEPQAEHVEIAIFAGDHGIMEDGVSAFPQAVTAEMVKNFIGGGAAISVLARQLHAGLMVINAGIAGDQGFDDPVVDQPVAPGTRNFVDQPAMSPAECGAALHLGRQIIHQYTDTVEIVIGGEMGIGNTSAASALGAALGAGDIDQLVGPGTGLDDAGVARKRAVVQRGLDRVAMAEEMSPFDILCQFGGFEIAALVGFYIAAAQRGLVIVVDGFISGVAALAAVKLNPGIRSYMLFGHGSAEPGHRVLLKALNAEPLLHLGMRLGEGSGAAVAVSLLRMACALHNEMATFAEAGIPDAL